MHGRMIPIMSVAHAKIVFVLAIISTQISNINADTAFRNNYSSEGIKCKQFQSYKNHEEMQILLAQLQDNNNDIGVKCSPMKSREDSTYLLEASMHSDSRLFINFGSQHEEVEVVNDQFCAEDLEADVKADLEMQENDPKKLAIILIIAVVNVGSLVMCCSVPSIINHDDRVQNVPEKKEWVPVFLRSHFMPVVRNGARVELTLTPAHAESEKNEVVRVTPKFMSKYNPLAMDLQDGSLFEPGLINATSTLAHEDDETFSMTDPENNDYVYTDNVNEVLNVNPQMATE